MARCDLRPDGVRLLGGEELEGDGMPCRRDGGEDVIPVGALTARRAQRGNGERLEACREEADSAVVTSVRVHGEARRKQGRS